MIHRFSSVTSAQSPDCIQYFPPLPPPASGNQLRCSSYLPPCSYVTTPLILPLSVTEAQLDELLNDLLPDLRSGELDSSCLDAFLSLYCLQVYGLCGRLVGGAFEPIGGGGGRRVCPEDCARVIGGVCGQRAWSILSTIVQELRGGGILELPPLTQLETCNKTESDVATSECVPLSEQGETTIMH